ncbi:hypothetical protein [Paraburkholderia diazotrophica]|uniref:Uncharacterized protein n=1 Tax=Paraburkholderia diazotrophica TaxID=667676 RepID=A0A1H7DBL2_9BURK|nr:hypothetical protein [Paraburkholderia diazotrophica]SEJ99229.1 hypothetical protein SAMN05192539_102854 [Paraburkholderia diazotrophica]
MSFGFRVGVAVGLLCASMAARAEYKEVWNPPEAAPGVRHVMQSKHSAPVGSGAATGAHRHAAAPRAKVAAAKPDAKIPPKKAGSVAAGAGVKTAHASAAHVATRQGHAETHAQGHAQIQGPPAKPVAAVATPSPKPAQTANVPAPQANSGGAIPRELPPILK